MVKRQRTTTRRVEVDDKDLPFKERCLPAFISLASVESAANDLDQDSSNLVTSPTRKSQVDVFRVYTSVAPIVENSRACHAALLNSGLSCVYVNTVCSIKYRIYHSPACAIS